ncbi:hypothetical protein ACFFIF_11840 [Vagococcus entomophilus]|uniref:LXG domain-containing protein n=1 Tax=Vagococcus entomophilus TaxID=1160095 RepID=A0A430AEW0_9ENTE|nr:hypothetical protein [Vagococcus entomophilus]RSU05976.1 hypothetical protein CBF30_11745 [Vagococcus entomophilus]
MLNEQYLDNSVEQGIASYVDYLNNIRLSDLLKSLDEILSTETDKLSDLATRSANALSNLDLANLEIENLINTNRGGKTGVHGFIAEFAETGIRNARDAFQGLKKSVVLLNDNGLADILLQSKEVQMKFYANILEEIRQASIYYKMSMMFPKDHVKVIEKIMSGAKIVEHKGNKLSISKINNIRKAIEDESAVRGVSYDEWLKSSVLKYHEVQKATIDQTLSGEVNDINRQTSEQQADIKKQAKNDRLVANQKAQPNFGEASKVAGIGTAVQGGLNLGIFVYDKHKNGKEVWNFDSDDWKQCGVTTANGAIKGGISGYAIYGLTNVCHLAAPSAGAITSGTFGLSSAIVKYRRGDVDTDGFIDLVILNAVDATGAAIGAAIGQTIIPIPVVGALVGSIVTATALNLGKGILNKHEIEVINRYQEKIKAYVSKLDKEYQIKLNELMRKYRKLGELQKYSFNLDINIQLSFASSIDIARLVGVSEKEILKNQDEIDNYFIS